MPKPFQTEASIAREKNAYLFEDTRDQCAEESAPAPAGNSIEPQQPGSEKLMESATAILKEVGKTKQLLDKCLDRFDPSDSKTVPKGAIGWLRAGVEWRYVHHRCWDDAYKTLALCQWGSFIKWPQIGPDGKTEHKLLQRCHFYPALITETMRMAFVRVTKEQITYMKDGIKARNPKFIGKTLFKVSVKLPKENTQHRNIIITLERVRGGEVCNLEFLFDGEQFHLVNIISAAQFYDNGCDALVKAELINRPEVLDDFLQHCLSPFRFSKLDIYRKDLEEYLSHIMYKVGLAEAVGTNFFIIQEDDRAI